MLDQRGRLLRAPLGFLSLDHTSPSCGSYTRPHECSPADGRDTAARRAELKPVGLFINRALTETLDAEPDDEEKAHKLIREKRDARAVKRGDGA